MIHVAEGPVTRVTIDRPTVRNALDLATIASLHRVLDQSAHRVLVITGAGDHVFCSGADLPQVMHNPEGRRDAARAYGRLLAHLAAHDRPVVARLNGHCLAGGTGLLLAADLAVMPEDATISLPEAAVGMWPAMIGAFLPAQVGRKRAMELALTGRRLTGVEAVEWGLVNRAVPRAALDETTAALTDAVIARSPSAIRIGRRAWADAAPLPLPNALELLAAALGDVMDTQDAVEGLTAFLQKRPPTWKDE